MTRRIKAFLSAIAAMLLLSGLVAPPAQAFAPTASASIRHVSATITANDPTTAHLEFTVACERGRHYFLYSVRLDQTDMYGGPASLDFEREIPCGSRISMSVGNTPWFPPGVFYPGAATLLLYLTVCDADNIDCNWNIDLAKNFVLQQRRS